MIEVDFGMVLQNRSSAGHFFSGSEPDAKSGPNSKGRRVFRAMAATIRQASSDKPDRYSASRSPQSGQTSSRVDRETAGVS